MPYFSESELRRMLVSLGGSSQNKANGLFINSNMAVTASHVVGELLLPSRAQVVALEEKLGCSSDCHHIFNQAIHWELPSPSAYAEDSHGTKHRITGMDNRARFDERNFVHDTDIALVITSREETAPVEIAIGEPEIVPGMLLESYTIADRAIDAQKGEVIKVGYNDMPLVLTSLRGKFGYSGSPVFSGGKLIGVITNGKEVPETDGKSPLIFEPITPIAPLLRQIKAGTYQPRKYVAKCASQRAS